MKSFDIKMITWNARSIKNKLTFIQSFTFTKSIHILCLTETWLLPTINNNEILPSNYEIILYRRDRHSIGGDVLIAISNNLPSRLVYTVHDIELIVVEILLPNPVTLICVVTGRRKSSHFLQQISSELLNFRIQEIKRLIHK